MKDDTAERIANSHALIQEKPVDRLDCLNKSASIRMVIMSCVAYLDQLYQNPKIMEFTREDLDFIHQQVSVSAIPLLDMVEHFMKLTGEGKRKYSLAV